MSDEGEPLREQLVVKSLGYLKFPDQFVDRYGIEKTKVPSPQAKIRQGDDKVQLVFEWQQSELAQARVDKEE